MSLRTDRRTAPFRIEHSSHDFAQQIPADAVLLGILKSVEVQLRKRGLVGSDPQAVTPLWYLAETERNVFLWRQGKSIDDHRDFEFWVDVRALIAKRRSQLERPDGFNPFVNSLWASAPQDGALLERERHYIEDIEDLCAELIPQAAALSHASRTVAREFSPQATDRPGVVLPCAPLRERGTHS